MYKFSFIQQTDPEIALCIQQELNRQRQHIELIASENIVSRAVMAAMGSILTNKYAEGYPGKRYYGGCEFMDVAEDLARESEAMRTRFVSFRTKYKQLLESELQRFDSLSMEIFPELDQDDFIVQEPVSSQVTRDTVRNTKI